MVRQWRAKAQQVAPVMAVLGSVIFVPACERLAGLEGVEDGRSKPSSGGSSNGGSDGKGGAPAVGAFNPVTEVPDAVDGGAGSVGGSVGSIDGGAPTTGGIAGGEAGPAGSANAASDPETCALDSSTIDDCILE